MVGRLVNVAICHDGIYAYAKLLIINAGFVLPVDNGIPGVFQGINKKIQTPKL